MKARIVILLSILFIPVIGSAQEEELKNKIIWDEARPLAWSDFKGSADNKSPFNALTWSGIYYQVRQDSNDELTVKTETYFDPKKSWQIRKKVTDKLLEHEQHHFDVSEIYSRLFIKNMLEIELSSNKNTIDRIRQAYLQTLKDFNSFNAGYDKETEHSKNEEQQNTWNARINQMLLETKEYDLKEVKIQLTTVKSGE
jgi:hypothetical protein